MMFKDDIFGNTLFSGGKKDEGNDFDNDPFGGEDIFGGNTFTPTGGAEEVGNEQFDKICSDTLLCGAKFKLNDLLPGANVCPYCGKSLIDLKENPDQVKEPTGEPTQGPQLEFVLGDVLTIDKYGYLHIIDSEEEHRYEGRDRLKIYINGRVYKCECIMFDEYTVGRNSTTFCPDIDLSKIDFENRISRKHLMIYRDEDQFYVRNLSSKNTVHVNEALLSENESMVLNDKDKIILSNFIECEFEKAPQEGELINNVG